MEILVTMQVSFKHFLFDVLRAEEEMRYFISFWHSAELPHILKVIANLIKEYFSLLGWYISQSYSTQSYYLRLLR